MDPQFRMKVKSGVASFSNTAKSIEEAGIKSSLENINKFTGMLAANTDKFNKTFANLESVTDTLAAADLYNSVNNLKASLEKATLLIGNLTGGKGTAGQFMTNDSLYRNLSGSLESLNLLLQDMRTNPRRYVHFSVFGKKNIPAE
jgi:phospholipid/cholesterol/gamma-HCH transport system substrate-binding protein